MLVNCFKQTFKIDKTILCRDRTSFTQIGYGGNRVHFTVNVPKKYSISVAITMLKSSSSRRIFEEHPNFRKRYPNGIFWSRYEHHESIQEQKISKLQKNILKARKSIIKLK